MRMMVATAMVASLLAVSEANAFFGFLSQLGGGYANLNSGDCSGRANSLWDDYCQPKAADSGCGSQSCSYGPGFGAYACCVPPAPCGSPCCAPANGCCTGPLAGLFGHHGCCGGNPLKDHFHRFVDRIRCHGHGHCCSAGNAWSGGEVGCCESSCGQFDGGVSYGTIDSYCSGGGCSNGTDGYESGQVIQHDVPPQAQQNVPSQAQPALQPAPLDLDSAQPEISSEDSLLLDE